LDGELLVSTISRDIAQHAHARDHARPQIVETERSLREYKLYALCRRFQADFLIEIFEHALARFLDVIPTGELP
jgi:hypothetical protein